jgi:hypothetical protein
MWIDLTALPEIGHVETYRDHPFTVVEIHQHQTDSGLPLTLIEWQSECMTCGTPYGELTTLRSKPISRRCKECRKQPLPPTPAQQENRKRYAMRGRARR